MFSQASMILFTEAGGVYQTHTPDQADTPQDEADTPQTRTRQTRPRPGRHLPAPNQAEISSRRDDHCSGRYASYCNAILCIKIY